MLEISPPLTLSQIILNSSVEWTIVHYCGWWQISVYMGMGILDWKAMGNLWKIDLG